MIGIYAIENRLNKRVYVGKSTDILKRWEQHLRLLEKGHHHSFELQSDYDELGIKNFSFRILELCDEDQLEEREIYWISKYNAETDGYNMTDKSYRPQAVLEEENKQLKKENERLKKELQALMLIQKGIPEKKEDDMYEKAYELVIKTRTASVSFLQKHLRIGYARASRIIDMLEANGVIGPHQGGSMTREVLIEPDNGELDGTETDGYKMTDKAVLDDETKQLKMENEKLKNELRSLLDEVKQLRKENQQIKKEKAKKENVNEITDEELYKQAYSLVVKARTASVSLLQRNLRIGYSRAARLIDMLERNGVVGPYQGSMPREVLIEPDDGELDGTA